MGLDWHYLFGVVIINHLNSTTMSNNNRDHSGSRGNDNSITRHKGESQQSNQKGARSVSTQNTGKHMKDESHGSDKNTTKRGENSI